MIWYQILLYLPLDGVTAEQSKWAFGLFVLVIPDAGFDAEKTFERGKQGLMAFGFHPDRVLWAKNGVMIACIVLTISMCPAVIPLSCCVRCATTE